MTGFFDDTKQAIRKTTADLVAELMKNQIEDLRERTAKGQDVNYLEFADYSPRYAADKLRMIGSNSPVNLWLYGDMIPNYQITRIFARFDGAEVIAGFTDQAEAWKAYQHDYGVNQKQREFIGITEPEADRRAQEAQAYLDKMWRS
jgi:hypothetical protein